MKITIKYISLFIIVMFNLGVLYAQSPSMVWTNAEGGGRNEYVYFRRDIKLCESPLEALIHLYADSRYALYINQVYIGFGPARSFHAHPTYDTYDIAPYLHKGDNTIAVKALSNGMVTYQLFDYKGGFTAWGEIKDGKKIIDLTIMEDWKCKKSESYDQSAPRFSFATGAIENLDTRKDVGWNDSEISIHDWQKPVVLLDQNTWGELTPRTIPYLTQDESITTELISAFTLAKDEDLYSFRVSADDENVELYNQNHAAIAYTYIYTPEKKSITAGFWWGDYYLNGKRVIEQKKQKRSEYRKDYTLDLTIGWNLLVSRHGVIWGSWDFNIALPSNEGLVLSTNKNKDSKNIFESFGPFEGMYTNESMNKVDLIQDISQIKKILKVELSDKEWCPQGRNKTSNHPARDLVWNSIDFDAPLVFENNLSNKIAIPPHERGTALIYDMGEMQLGRIFVEGNFEDGTIIDIGFSEEKNAVGTPWLYKRYQIGAGHRFIASKNQKRYETFKPYGVRYLQINIMNTRSESSVSKVGIVRQVYPMETVGSFECSDPLLNKIWKAGWNTLQLCAEDTYTDTPFRERGLYAGDMLPEGAITMAVSGDTRLLAHSLNVFQDMYHKEMYENKENLHGDFPLITLVTMDHYLQYTGDWTFIERHYENYNSLIRNYISRKTKEGLLHTDQVFIEWTSLNKHDAEMTTYQALAVKSLHILQEWAIKLQKTKDAQFFKQEASLLTKNINNYLWDERSNKFWDGMQHDTIINIQHITSSIWPALYDVVGEDRKDKIVEMLKSEIKDVITGHRQNKIAPYSSFYLFALLYQSGEPGLAEAFMKKHWGPMALHSETVWENFGISGENGTSSHAWSGHPTYFLSSEVLGVNLGFYKTMDRNVVNIEPQSATLSWAKGSVAHPMGKVDVSWKVMGNKLMLNFTAPNDVKVVVKPKGRLGVLDLWVNGKLRN